MNAIAATGVKTAASSQSARALDHAAARSARVTVSAAWPPRTPGRLHRRQRRCPPTPGPPSPVAAKTVTANRRQRGRRHGPPAHRRRDPRPSPHRDQSDRHRHLRVRRGRAGRTSPSPTARSQAVDRRPLRPQRSTPPSSATDLVGNTSPSRRQRADRCHRPAGRASGRARPGHHPDRGRVVTQTPPRATRRRRLVAFALGADRPERGPRRRRHRPGARPGPAWHSPCRPLTVQWSRPCRDRGLTREPGAPARATTASAVAGWTRRAADVHATLHESYRRLIAAPSSPRRPCRPALAAGRDPPVISATAVRRRAPPSWSSSRRAARGRTRSPGRCPARGCAAPPGAPPNTLLTFTVPTGSPARPPARAPCPGSARRRRGRSASCAASSSAARSPGPPAPARRARRSPPASPASRRAPDEHGRRVVGALAVGHLAAGQRCAPRRRAPR